MGSQKSQDMAFYEIVIDNFFGSRKSQHMAFYKIVIDRSMTIFEAVIKIVIDWSMTILWGLEKVRIWPFMKLSLTGQ